MLMRVVNRRRFLQLAGGATALSVLTPSIARAASIPANRRTGTIRDVEHIVVLMQENRSFDHYFGTMRGVRGFGDPHPVTLPSGRPVWYQADGATVVPPFRPDVGNLALTFIQDLPHGWNDGHAAFNGGNWDQWIPAKTATTMAHLNRAGHSVPLRAGRRVHGLRRATTARCSVRPTPTATTCGPAGTATTGTAGR